MRWIETADGCGLAIHRAVDDLIAIDCRRNRAAHLDIIERRLGVVHREDDFAFGIALIHTKTRIGLKLLQQFRRGETGKSVQLFCHHCSGCCRRVGDKAERHLVERDAVRVTVIGILNKRQTIAACPAVKLEWASTDRCCIIGFSRFDCDNGAIAFAHVEQEKSVPVFKLDLDGAQVQRYDIFNRFEDLFRGIYAVLCHCPVEGKQNIL